MKNISIISAIAIFLYAPASLACSIAPPPPNQTEAEKIAEQQEREQAFILSANRSLAIVRVRVIDSSEENLSSGRVKIIETLYGDMRVGKNLKLRTIGTSLCGAGQLRKDQEGIIILEKGDNPLFQGFLTNDGLEILRKNHVIK